MRICKGKRMNLEITLWCKQILYEFIITMTLFLLLPAPNQNRPKVSNYRKVKLNKRNLMKKENLLEKDVYIRLKINRKFFIFYNKKCLLKKCTV